MRASLYVKLYLCNRLFKDHPEYKSRFPGLPEGADEEACRGSETFREQAVEMFNLLDGVMASLEAVDKLLQELRYDAPATNFTKNMIKVKSRTWCKTVVTCKVK